MKVCTDCGKKQELNNFGKSSQYKGGYRNCCRKCSSIRTLKTSRTEVGVIRTIYNGQLQRVKKKRFASIEYSLSELTAFLYSTPAFKELYTGWVSSDYDRAFKPSVDRLDDYSTYSLGNITITTYQKNVDRGNRDRKAGINNKLVKKSTSTP